MLDEVFGICERYRVASKLASCVERERVKRGWTYRKLAAHLGVPLSQAHDWATGNAEPRIDNIKLISKRLSLPISELLA